MKKWLVYATLLVATLALLVPGRTAVNAQTGLQLVPLAPTAEASATGLDFSAGAAFVNVETGYLWVDVPVATLPDGAVLEAWLIDEPAQTNASDADEVYGVTFGSAPLAELLNSAPFAQSAGILSATDSDSYALVYQHANSNFSPYDTIAITLESNSQSATFDPRPATVVFSGDIASGTPADVQPAPVVEPSFVDGIRVDLSNIADNTPFGNLSGAAEIYVGGGTASVTLNTNGVALPDGTVLEAWLWEAGLETNGPGTSNASNADEAFGLFVDETASDRLARTFYTLSLGVLQDNGDGTLSLEATFPGYNFGPYDAVVITHEGDGNSTAGYDPRPGSAILLATVDQGVPLDATVAELDVPAWANILLRNVRTGEEYTLADLASAGLTVHVEPMATWCSNCLRQQQTVREVFNTVDPTQVIFISLSVQTNITEDTLTLYANNQDFEWTFSIAGEEMLQLLVDEFGRSITNPPSTPSFVLFPDGSYTNLKTGFSSAPQIREFARIGN
jgi:hypothetical protein